MASGGVRQVSFAKNTSKVWNFSEGMRTHTLLDHPLGKSLEAKLLKEMVEDLYTLLRHNTYNGRGSLHSY